MFGLRLPWTAAPGVQPADARRPRQSPRAVLSHDRRSGSPPMPPGRRAPPPEAAGEDCGAAAGELPDAVAQAMEGAFSANTKRALKADLRIYTAWCAEQGREALPASPDTVAAFVDAMAATRAPATVRRYVASIAAAHRAAGSPEAQRSPAVTLALKPHAPRQGTPPGAGARPHLAAPAKTGRGGRRPPDRQPATAPSWPSPTTPCCAARSSSRSGCATSRSTGRPARPPCWCATPRPTPRARAPCSTSRPTPWRWSPSGWS